MFTYYKKTLFFLGCFGLLTFATPSICSELSVTDKRDVSRIETYLNDIIGLRADFLQVATNGTTITGKLVLSRPGKMRLEYDPPSPVTLIANGDFLVHIDRELKHNSHFFVDKTPLAFLLKDEISLDEGLQIIRFSRGLNTLVITLTQKKNKDQGTISVVFSDNPLSLKKWIINDAQGIRTTISLNNTERLDQIDSTLFDISNIIGGK